MMRFSWWSLIRREIPCDVYVSPYCSRAVQEDLVKALECLEYAVTEARIKKDLRWFYLVTVQYMLLQAIAMCDDELAEKIKGKTPEELQEMKHELITILKNKYLRR